MNELTPVHPPMSYYWFSVPCIVFGMGLFLYTLMHGIFHLTDSLTQVVVPGSVELTFKKGLTYTVFLEEESVVNGKIFLTRGAVGGLTCNVKSGATGEAVDIWPAQSSVKYDVGRRSGRSVLSFTVPEDGGYGFACQYAEGTNGPETVVAVGTGIGGKIVKIVFIGMAEMFGGEVLALIVFLWIFWQRERAQKLLRPPMQPAG